MYIPPEPLEKINFLLNSYKPQKTRKKTKRQTKPLSHRETVRPTSPHRVSSGVEAEGPKFTRRVFHKQHYTKLHFSVRDLEQTPIFLQSGKV